MYKLIVPGCLQVKMLSCINGHYCTYSKEVEKIIGNKRVGPLHYYSQLSSVVHTMAILLQHKISTHFRNHAFRTLQIVEMKKLREIVRNECPIINNLVTYILPLTLFLMLFSNRSHFVLIFPIKYM